MTDARPRRPVAIMAHAAMPADPRVRRQADALLQAGHEVDVLALRESGQPAEERHEGLRILRLPVHRRFAGFAGHLAEYAAFTAVAAWRLTREHRRRRYGLVQVATLPDFLVAAAAALKLNGVPLLLDLHEDMPAFFEDRFSALPLRPLRPLIRGVARGSAAMADHLLTVHEPLRALAVARGMSPGRVTVVMNSADETIFDRAAHPVRPFMWDGVLRLVHHSALQRIYGLEVALEAVAALGAEPAAPLVRLDVYGDGPHRSEIEASIARLGLGDRVELHGRVPMEALPALIASSDLGLVPTLPEPYLQLSLSTKLLEYVAMGLPVIASELATFRAHLDGSAVRYVPGGDAAALAAAITEAARDPEVMRARAQEAIRQAAPYAWSRQKETYLGVVDRLMAGHRASDHPARPAMLS
ncbi:MAG: glycosyltransferase [Candidatus Limnocylindria bacterium]